MASFFIKISRRLVALSALAVGLIASDVTARPAPALPTASATAARQKTRFVNAHPIAPPKGGFCYIDVPHVHDYSPNKPALYQPVGDQLVFTGDPVPFGYDGDKFVYYGHHPVPLPQNAGFEHASPTFCFMKGPHYHNYQAPEGPGFKQKDKVMFYVGAIPPEAAQQRPQVERALEVEYRPFVAQRPQVVVIPPPEWQGVVWIPPPQVVIAPAASVVVAPVQPTVVVMPPRPTVIVAPAPVIQFGGWHGKGKGWKGKGKGWKGKGKHW